MTSRRHMTAALFLLASTAPAAVALGPEDVYILVNKNVADSQAVADYYCAKRGVPKDHVVALDLPSGEDVGRADYDAKLAGPLRDRLKDKRDKVKVLLTVYGVPLRVGPKEPNADEKAELEKVKKELQPLEKNRKDLDDEIKGLEAKAKDDPNGVEAALLIVRRKDRADLENQVRPLEGRRKRLSYEESAAAVDSELALLWNDDYDLRRWQLNLLYFQVPEEVRKDKPPMLMTCRLDGPSVELVKQHHRPIVGGGGERLGRQGVRGRPRHQVQPGRRPRLRLRRLRRVDARDGAAAGEGRQDGGDARR